MAAAAEGSQPPVVAVEGSSRELAVRSQDEEAGYNLGRLPGRAGHSQRVAVAAGNLLYREAAARKGKTFLVTPRIPP